MNNCEELAGFVVRFLRVWPVVYMGTVGVGVLALLFQSYGSRKGWWL